MENNQNFDEWLKTFKKSINTYNYYMDFTKIYENIKQYKTELDILNNLVGSENIENDFEIIFNEHPECLKAIPALLAVRENKIFCKDETGEIDYNFKEITQTLEQYKYFMRKTGLFDMLQNHIINNLYDYMMGVEVGLNTNGRKNRGGHQMEDLVEEYIIKARFIKNNNYFKEMYLNEIEKKWNINLSKINSGGISTKRFDFVIYYNNIIYAIETNFYTNSGSKLNEVARSYEAITLKSKDIKNFKFIWITDGQGWISAKNNLKETFNVKRNIFNINDMENGLFNKIYN